MDKNKEVAWKSNYWAKDNADDLDKFLKEVASKKDIWETFGKILDKKIKSSSGVRDFEKTLCWSEATAFDKGKVAAYKDILKLIPRPEV